MKRPKATEKKGGRPPKPKGRSPVIAARVSASVHQRIQDAAKASGRSMSEEMAFRLWKSFYDEDEVKSGWGPTARLQSVIDAAAQAAARAMLSLTAARPLQVSQSERFQVDADNPQLQREHSTVQ